jgi:fibronectin-binding autotransporter adhesin
MFSRSTILLAAASAMAVGIGLGASTASATPTTGWLQTAGGTYVYGTLTNWVGGTINGTWASGLALTGNQIVQMTAAPASTSLSFDYAGSSGSYYSLTLDANAVGGETLTLPDGTGITDLVGNYKVVTLGGIGNNALNINLGSSTSAQTIALGSGSHLVINNVISGSAPLTYTATGGSIVNASPANTYTGVTTIGGTNLSFYAGALANGGVASSVGESSSAASNLVLGSLASLIYAGAGPASTDRLFTVAGNGATIRSNGQDLSFTNNGAVAFTGTTAATLTFAQSASLIFDPLISNVNSTHTTSVVLQDNVGALALTLNNAANSYTGVTSAAYGSGATLIVSYLANGGVASDIGASSSVASNLTFTPSDTLEYVGAGSSTNRNFTVAYNTADTGGGTFTINSSGTGALVMSGTQTYSITTSTDTLGLALDGSSAANLVNEYIGAIVNPTGTSSTGGTYHYTVTKSGSNTWALGGANTYTGATTVNGGALLINGSLASASAVAVNSGGTLGGNGTIGGVVTLASGGVLEPSFDSATPTTLTVGGLSADSGSTIDLTVSGASSDSVKVSNSGGLTYGGTLAIADALPQAGTYTLFSFTGGGASDFGAVTVNGNSLTDPIGIWTGAVGGFDFSFAEGTGILTVSEESIPEPATLALMAAMGTGLLLVGRKRKVA